MAHKINFQYPVYPDLTLLPEDKRAHACWTYYTLAQKQKERVGKSIEDQILLEGELWMDTHYVQTARTVALVYGLESPSEMFKFWKYVWAQAQSLRLPLPSDEYTGLKSTGLWTPDPTIIQ